MNSITFPISSFSFFLTSDFKGSKYVSCFVSNQIAVFHSVLPVLANALSLPQPSSCHFRCALISLAKSTGIETKCQPLGDECRQGLALNVYFIFPFIRIEFF